MTGKFISVWDGGTQVITKAMVFDNTGQILTNPVDDVDDLDVLDDEFFISNDWKKYPVCKECHEYILIKNQCPQCANQ